MPSRSHEKNNPSFLQNLLLYSIYAIEILEFWRLNLLSPVITPLCAKRKLQNSKKTTFKFRDVIFEKNSIIRMSTRKHFPNKVTPNSFKLCTRVLHLYLHEWSNFQPIPMVFVDVIPFPRKKNSRFSQKCERLVIMIMRSLIMIMILPWPFDWFQFDWKSENVFNTDTYWFQYN